MDDQGGRLITLKSLTPAQGLLHERQELEVRLPAHGGLDPATWPACDATELASQLSQNQPLVPLFELRQERYQRLATPVGSATPVVELSIDRTRFNAAEDDLLGVEAELLPGNDRTALQAIIDDLHLEWGLTPEPTSKFERGLAQAQPELFSLLSVR
jgi:inorganic triphosphatase YgiF